MGVTVSMTKTEAEWRLIELKDCGAFSLETKRALAMAIDALRSESGEESDQFLEKIAPTYCTCYKRNQTVACPVHGAL